MGKRLLQVLLISFFTFIANVTFAANVIILGGTELVGELVTPLNSKTNKKDDPIIFKLAQNLVINNAIILEKGTSGRAVVTRAHKAAYFGQGGGIGFEPEVIKTINGIEIPLSFETQRRGSAVNDANMVVATVGLGLFAVLIFLCGLCYVPSNSAFASSRSKSAVLVVYSNNSGTTYNNELDKIVNAELQKRLEGLYIELDGELYRSFFAKRERSDRFLVYW